MSTQPSRSVVRSLSIAALLLCIGSVAATSLFGTSLVGAEGESSSSLMAPPPTSAPMGGSSSMGMQESSASSDSSLSEPTLPCVPTPPPEGNLVQLTESSATLMGSSSSSSAFMLDPGFMQDPCTSMLSASSSSGDESTEERKKCMAMWQIQPAMFTTDTEKFKPVIKLDDKYCNYTMRNRRALRSVKEFPNGSETHVMWAWTEGKTEMGYHDNIAIALRTDGLQREGKFWDIINGIIVRFDPAGSRIVVYKATNALGAFEIIELGAKEDVSMNMNDYYEIKVVDKKEDGIDIFFRKKDSQDSFMTPVLSIPKEKLPARGNKNYVMFYNREPGGGTGHESQLSEPNVKALP